MIFLLLERYYCNFNFLLIFIRSSFTKQRILRNIFNKNKKYYEILRNIQRNTKKLFNHPFLSPFCRTRSTIKVFEQGMYVCQNEKGLFPKDSLCLHYVWYCRLIYCGRRTRLMFRRHPYGAQGLWKAYHGPSVQFVGPLGWRKIITLSGIVLMSSRTENKQVFWKQVLWFFVIYFADHSANIYSK